MLVRAVQTALEGFNLGEAEVIIVPNGRESQWREAVAKVEGLPDVHIYPITQASANAARNYGLACAKGSLVRFLDDDDFLIPEVAVKQCRELLALEADVSSYAIRIEDEDGKHCSMLIQPDTDDFMAAQLSPLRLPLPHPHVYKRSLIANLLWNEQYVVAEDIAWLHTIAHQTELDWVRSDDVVGVWYQHKGERLSYAYAAHEPNRITATSILDTIEKLQQQGRMNEQRWHAAVEGLWTCIHRGFYLQPLHWHKIAKIVLGIDPASKPHEALFSSFPFKYISPLIIEWLMLPKRYLNHRVRMLKGRLFGWGYTRNL